MAAPTVYYPIPRPAQADKTGNSRAVKVTPDKQPPSVTDIQAFSYERRYGATPIAIKFPDKQPPSVTDVQAFSYDRRYGATPVAIKFPDKQPPSVEQIQAFSYDRRYGATFVAFLPATVPPPAVPPQLVNEAVAFSYPEPIQVTRWKLDVPDLLPRDIPSTRVSAFSYELLYGARAIRPPTAVVAAALKDYKTFVKAHEPTERYQVNYGILGYADLIPAEVHKVSAFEYEQRYGAKPTFIAPVVVVNFYPPEYHSVQAHTPLQIELGPRAYWKYPDRIPPSVEKISAFDLPPRLLDTRLYAPPFADLQPPSVEKVSAFDLPQVLLNTRAKLDYAQAAPPSVEKIAAFDLPQRLLDTRLYYPPFADLQPPSVEKITAFELPQKLLDSRIYYPPFADKIAPYTEYVKAHSYDYGYGATFKVTLPTVQVQFYTPEYHSVKAIDVPLGLLGSHALYPPFADRAPQRYSVVAHDPIQFLLGSREYEGRVDAAPLVYRVSAFDLPQHLLDVRAYPAYADLAPPEVHRIAAFDLEQKLLQTRAYWKYADYAPPEVHRIAAHTFEYLFGGRYIPIAVPAVINLYPPESHYVTAYDAEQKFLLGTRAYWKYADLAPIVERVVAFDLDQNLLGPRAYPAFRPADRPLPETHSVAAFSFEQLYGGRPTRIPFSLQPVNFYPPTSIYVRAHDPEQKFMLGTRALWKFPDRIPPDVTAVTAIEILQHFLDTRYVPPAAFDLAPPEVTRIVAHDPEQKPLLPHYYVVVADLYPPSVNRVSAFDLPQKPLLPAYYIGRVDRKPPEVHKVVAHDPVFDLRTRFIHIRISIVSATYVQPWEALQSVTATYIDPYEANIGVRSTWSDPWEALVGITSTTTSPYEGAGTGILSLYSLPWEALRKITTSVNEAYESLQGISFTKTNAYEAPSRATLINALPYEARGWVTHDLVLAYEALQSLTRSVQSPYEVLFGQALTGQLPWEAVSQLVPRHVFEMMVFAHYYLTMTRHFEGHVFTHLATEPKQTRRR